MKKYSFLFAMLFSTVFYAQEVSRERVVNVLSALASDEMKGRAIGTPQNDSAAVYIANRFKENNLSYCTGDSYLVPFEYKGKVAYNVCGIKKGKSEKTLAYSAHSTISVPTIRVGIMYLTALMITQAVLHWLSACLIISKMLIPIFR
nr:hypothetical protein [Kaistella soli]